MNETDPTHEESASTPDPTAHISTVLLWAAVVGIAGGFACGKALFYFHPIGGVALLPLGCIAGWVSRKVLAIQQRRLVALICAGCLVALPIALTCWVRWNDREGMEGWLQAVKLLPTIARETKTRGFVAGTILCSICGTAVAYWIGTRRIGRAR